MFACDSINSEDYNRIINKKINTRNFQIVNYSVKPLSKKSGIFGEHYILNIRVRVNDKIDELNYFLKTLPQLESQKNFTIEMGAFYKEEQMFKLFVPMFLKNEIKIISECAPKCYLSQPDNLIIFEDLSSKGFKCLNARESFDLNLVKLAINTMVKLHASGLILEEKMSKQTGRDWRLNEEFPKEFQEMLYCMKPPSLALIESCVKGTITQIHYLLKEKVTEEFNQFTQKAINDLTEYVKPSKQFRNAICHGDLWAANIMFKIEDKKPTDCFIVDYQSYRYCPPAQDLLTFIYLSTNREFRSKHLQEVLDYYYLQLKTTLYQNDINPENVITYKDFIKSCKDQEIFAIIQSVTHFQIVMMSSENMGEFLADSEFSKDCMFNDRSKNIIKMCEIDPFYKEKQVESVNDLLDLYMKKFS